jgi:glycolate oxidase FAD binding subunit
VSVGLPGLVDAVGPAHCLVGADCAPFVVDGRTPCAVVFPGSAEATARVVGLAAAAGVPVVPWGGGTQTSLGAPPPEGALVVGTRRLARILEHEPGDLTATVEAGLTLEALQAGLGARGQWLPLDPPQPGAATLGGILATNAAGPRRHGYGTARDLVLGLRVVTPGGELVRAGGKVVKNVAGYDLAKLYIGALGTLGLIVEATVKLRPRPETEAACWAWFPDLARAAGAAHALGGGELVPAALQLLDGGAGEACGREAGLAAARAPAVLVAFDGIAATVAWQQEEAARRLTATGAATVARLDGDGTGRALAAVREVRRVVPGAVALATATVLPADLGPYLEEAAAAVAAGGFALAAAAGVGHGGVTLVLAGGRPAGGAATAMARALARCRDAARARGGHLVVESAPLGVREACPAWDPPGPTFALFRGLKERLDPRGLMNPGRFVGGL